MRTALRQLLLALATNGSGAQTFLGARWIRALLNATPASRRRSIALWLLSLSPHYFYTGGERPARRGRMAQLEADFQRMGRSRARLAEAVVAPHLGAATTVLDYGCGPGLLAAALGRHATRVVACDISDGVLACAEVLRPAGNVEYTLVPPAGPLPLADESIDVMCSFAVVQHVSEEVLTVLLAEFHRILRPGAVALWHVPVDDESWRSEATWRADRSPRGRLKLRYGLNCFGRTRGDVISAIEGAGFRTLDVARLGTFGDLLDQDLSHEELFVCEKAVAS